MAMPRVAVVGVEHWHAKRHIEAFHKAGAKIVAVAGSQAAAERFANEYNCLSCSDLEEAVTAARPDFVMTMGTPRQMADRSLRLIELKIPFGVEKPIGISATEAADVANAAKASSAFAAVPFVSRYSKIWQELSVTSGRIGYGTVSHAHFHLMNGPPSRYIADGVDWMVDPAIAGGGCLRNLGIHGADAFLHLTGGEPYNVVAATCHNRIHREMVEEFAAGIVVSQSGVVMTIEAGYTYGADKGGDYELRVAANDAYISDRDTTLHVADLARGIVTTSQNTTQAQRYDAFAVDVLQRLESGAPPTSTVEDCHNAMQLIDRLYEAARETSV